MEDEPSAADAESRMLGAECWAEDAAFSTLDAGCWMLGAGCWASPDAGCCEMGAGCWMLNVLLHENIEMSMV